MKPQEYIDRNLKGYEGDEFIHIELRKLVKQFNINHIIETGTYLGGTARRLAEFAPVHTVEFENSNYFAANRNCKGYNVTIGLSSSPTFLRNFLPDYKDKSLLFYLDAHWQKHCPLLEELEIIAEHKIEPVICIHDFHVPNRPELGYDEYNGQRFDFEWIHEHIKAIYPNGFAYHYNNEASGAMRGIIYIYPAKKKRGRPKAK